MGITKKNVIQNLGSMFDYIASFLIASVLALIIRIFRNKHPWIMKVYNYIAGILFFNLILRLIIEGYMDFSISSFLNVTNMLWNTKSDVAASIVTILTIIVVAVFPGLIWILVKKNHEKLQEKEKI
jgi:glucan phosphoethanolaminetransferase (alkaline phosphatase superfamily)